MPEANKIFRIPEHVSIKIAAGEVIENPSSVVKELVENAIDALSSRIDCEILGGGKKLIIVRDDGCGMQPEDARLCIERFTTSKLKIGENLLEDISTLGFRGEALASIASVSHFTLTTRAEGAESATAIYCEGGRVKEESRKAAPVGTCVEAKNLFFNFPARRKFLKTERTESARVESIFSRLALPYEDIEFTLLSDGKKLLNFGKGEAKLSRVSKLFPGKRVPSQKIENSAGDFSISGLISSPGTDFPTSSNLFIFVNDRLIRDKVITHAVCEALRTHIGSGKYPGGAIFLTVPKRAVDVNVHPTKAEVKFSDSNFIHSFVLESIKACLRVKGYHGIQPYTAKERDIYKPFSCSPQAQGGLRQVHSHTEFDYPQQRDMQQPQGGYFSKLQIIGQLKNSYLICGDDRGAVIIDQHAAHERLTFESLKRQSERKGVTSQDLMFPAEFTLKGERSALLGKRLDLFRSLGFLIENFGKDSFIIRSVPEILTDSDYVRVIEDILEMMVEHKSAEEWEKVNDELLETMACHSSVRFNKQLSAEEIRSLLRNLDSLDCAKTCPHGRPFAVWLDDSELKRMFKRT